jgi:TATA-box binding protein (TBP) (component of TFIID and TFIIIB)
MLVKIDNIVSHGELGFGLNLPILARKLVEMRSTMEVEYEPELGFPALIVKERVGKGKMGFSVFSNGKILFYGCKSEKDIKVVSDKAEQLISSVMGVRVANVR